MPQSHFLDRISEDLRREIGWVVTNRLRDPRVPTVVTIADVELSADTRNATIHVSIYGDEKTRKTALIALNHAAPFLQKAVAERVSMRNFPRFFFKEDTSIERGMRIAEILREVHDDLERPSHDPEH